jgi:hypothetical protein
MCGGRSYLSLDDILPPPPVHMINDIEEESDDTDERHCPNPRSLPTTKIDFQKLQPKFATRIHRPQQSLEVIEK